MKNTLQRYDLPPRRTRKISEKRQKKYFSFIFDILSCQNLSSDKEGLPALCSGKKKEGACCSPFSHTEIYLRGRFFYLRARKNYL